MLESLDLRIQLYDVFNVVGYVVLIVYNFFNIREKKKLMSGASRLLQYRSFNKNKGFCLSENTFAVVEILLFSAFQIIPAAIFNPLMSEWCDTGANYFGLLFFAPIFLVALSLLLWVDPLKQIDLITPAFPLTLVFVKFACVCNGCCAGMEMKYGLYNYQYDYVEFPSQIVEMLLALLIFLFLLKIRKKAAVGTLYPIYLITYSATRFVSEFFRVEDNVLGIFKTYHLLCMAGVVIGIIALLLIKKFGGKISLAFEESFYFKKGELFEELQAARNFIPNLRAGIRFKNSPNKSSKSNKKNKKKKGKKKNKNKNKK